MNTIIEIHDRDTVNTGYYGVYFKLNGQSHLRICSEALVNSFLNMRQKEQFFMGKYRFKIHESDFNTLLYSNRNDKLKHKHEN